MGRAIREFRKASSDTKEEFAKATRAQAPAPAAPPRTAPESAPVDHGTVG